jgi:ammonium transporter, Amt family
MLKNLLDACGAGLAFYAVGYGLAYGHTGDAASTFIGNSNFFLSGDVNPAVFFFQYAFSATCVTIIAGTLAERCRMFAYFAYSVYLTGIVYPVVAHTICKFTMYLSREDKDYQSNIFYLSSCAPFLFTVLQGVLKDTFQLEIRMQLSVSE